MTEQVLPDNESECGVSNMERWAGKRKAASILGKAVLLTYVITALLLLLFAFLSLQFQLDAGQIGIGILCIYGIACLAGGWYVAGKAGKRRLFWGLGVGVLYFLILVLISGMGDRSLRGDWVQILSALFLCGASGTAGGIAAGWRG